MRTITEKLLVVIWITFMELFWVNYPPLLAFCIIFSFVFHNVRVSRPK